MRALFPGTPHAVLLEPPHKPEIRLRGRCRSQTDPAVFERILLLSGKHPQPRAGCGCSHHPRVPAEFPAVRISHFCIWLGQSGRVLAV